jgi:hypothetical protein
MADVRAITAGAAVEAINAGLSLSVVWSIASTLAETQRSVSRDVIVESLCAQLDAMQRIGWPVPDVGDETAEIIAEALPNMRRLMVVGLQATKGGDQTIASLFKIVGRIARLSAFKAEIPKPTPAPSPAPQQITVQLPEQPAPVVNVTNRVEIPEQPTPNVDVHVTNQAPTGPAEVRIVSLPDRMTETTVTRDREGNIKETVQLESDA